LGDPDSAVWRGFTRAELDAAYNNVAAVADSAERLASLTERSAAFRAARPGELDLPYGPRPRNRIDLFRCGRQGAPLFAFIHGGYWQRNSKEMFAVLAEGPLARGHDVALLGYTLAPEATLTEIVAEIHGAVSFLRREGPGRGVATGRLILSGWSAGGHLTAMGMRWPQVDAGLSISGLFDVEPCRLNYLNEKLRLTEAEAAAMSPVHQLPRVAGPLIAAFGEAELPELQRQSVDFFAAWSGAGLSGRLLPLPGHDHFSIVEELADPEGALARALDELAG
jgi:arylformamidase